MIEAKVQGDRVELTVHGSLVAITAEFFMLLVTFYIDAERNRPGAGEKFLGQIVNFGQAGLIKHWAKEVAGNDDSEGGGD